MNLRVSCKVKHVLLFMMLIFKARAMMYDPALDQLSMFKREHKCPAGILTTTNGAPIPYDESRNSLNTTSIVYNEFLMETITHGVREPIPERVVFAKGAGALGYFELKRSLKDICSAKLFTSVGKKTPVTVRFSADIVQRGGKDTTRDMRGFSVKFYTDEGNFDIVGINIPIFFLKDPIHYASLAHARRRNPATGLYDQNSLWDYITLRPETMFAFLYIYSDYGIPLNYRYMPGYSVHTYQVVNAQGENHFVRFYFTPDLGIKNLYSEEASQKDDDDFVRDLYKSIVIGKYPSWTLRVQVLSQKDLRNSSFDPFDVTRVLSTKMFPLRTVGKLVLNKNAENYFAEIEQLAVSPSNLIPGIPGPVDKMFEGRSIAYRETHFHRLGSNYYKILVNLPKCTQESTYIRDGSPPVGKNGRDYPNYYPNSFCGLAAVKPKVNVKRVTIRQKPANNFDQASEFVSNMNSGEKKRLVENLVYSLKPAAKFLQERAVKLLKKINTEIGNRVEKLLSDD